MHQCCVYGCNNIGSFSSPKDKKLRRLWEAATRCKDFRPKYHSKMCFIHFKSEDFIKIGKYSGLQNTRRILKPRVVPSIFSWSKTEDLHARRRRERAEACDARDAKRTQSYVNIDIKKSHTSNNSTPLCHPPTKHPTVIVTFDDKLYYDCVEEIVETQGHESDNIPKVMQTSEDSSFRELGTQKNSLFSYY